MSILNSSYSILIISGLILMFLILICTVIWAIRDCQSSSCCLCKTGWNGASYSDSIYSRGISNNKKPLPYLSGFKLPDQHHGDIGPDLWQPGSKNGGQQNLGIGRRAHSSKLQEHSRGRNLNGFSYRNSHQFLVGSHSDVVSEPTRIENGIGRRGEVTRTKKFWVSPKFAENLPKYP